MIANVKEIKKKKKEDTISKDWAFFSKYLLILGT